MSTSPHAPTLTLGDAMHVQMRQAGLTGKQMSELLEVTRFTVSAWLNNHRAPGVAVLMAWAYITGGSYEWLCAIRDSNPEPADYWRRGRDIVLPVFLPQMRAAA
jgi:transcriptional regulator with XRE-family HTH domain